MGIPRGLSIDGAKLGAESDGIGPGGRGIPIVFKPLNPEDMMSEEGKVVDARDEGPNDEAVVVVKVVWAGLNVLEKEV